MLYLGKFINNFKDFYNEINSATLTGAIDVVVIRQPDGTFTCSPFHVRFGKIGVLRSRAKLVDVTINGISVDLPMKLGETGEAFFVEEVRGETKIPPYLATSPLPAIPDIQAELNKMHLACDEEETRNTESEEIDISESLDDNIEKTATALDDPSSLNITSSSLPSDSESLLTDVAKSKSVLTLSTEKQSSETDISERSFSAHTDSGEECKTKRKRRRKVPSKKRSRDMSNQYPKNQDISFDTNDKAEDIFQMDNDYDESFASATSYLSRSISLPVSSATSNIAGSEWTPKKTSSTFTGEFHPFSDGDVSPQSTPIGSRPPSPKSDTEYENQKQEAGSPLDPSGPSWAWGQLPKQSQSQPPIAEAQSDPNKESSEADKRSMLGGMLNFMRSTKKMRHMPETEGIYLSELDAGELDPELAALYFPKFKSSYLERPDEDAESGNGPSLSHSPPNSQGYYAQDSDCDEYTRNCGLDYEIRMSLCGGLDEYDNDFPEERFLQSLVTHDMLAQNPLLFSDPNLVVSIEGKYYNWATAAAMVASYVVFQRPLPQETVHQLVEDHMPKKKKPKSYSSWFSWRRTESENKVEVSDKNVTIKMEVSTELKESTEQTLETPNVEILEDPPPEIPPLAEQENIVEMVIAEKPASNAIEIKNPEGLKVEIGDVVPEKSVDDAKSSEPKKEYMKCLRLTSQQIVKLNLKEGPNEALFSVTTAYQGTTRCTCHIFLWNYDDKIVISDIDGTITKSDVLGHILPMVGHNWAQLGVAKLFTKIQNNGYKFLYLSARAIGQARITREYLRSVRQGDVLLPDGPLLLSPTSMISALHREVIEKKPEEFKISCLKDIQALFPLFIGNPFYAGFGNKINDTWAYRAVGIPLTRVFTINHRGELKQEFIQTFQSSYTRLGDQVDHVFPPLTSVGRADGRPGHIFSSSEEFSYFTYWREPVPILDSLDFK